MRRTLIAALLFSTACLNGTLPTAVNSLVVASNAPNTGVFPGDQVQLNASALDAFGNTLPVAFTYSSSNAAVATVSTSGLISALSAGTSSIGVSTSGQSAHLTLTVDGNIENGVQVSPPDPTVRLGLTLQLTYTVTTTLGNTARNKTAVWSTADATKVPVSADGVITASAVTGGVQVCATASDNASLKGCTSVSVTP